MDSFVSTIFSGSTGAVAAAAAAGAGAAAGSAFDDEEISATDYCPALPFLGTEADPRVDIVRARAALFADETTRIRALAAAGDVDLKALTDLPLARIKRIMKSDEDVRMISAEAPVRATALLLGGQKSLSD